MTLEEERDLLGEVSGYLIVIDRLLQPYGADHPLRRDADRLYDLCESMLNGVKLQLSAKQYAK